jgi:hypothetical protein
MPITAGIPSGYKATNNVKTDCHHRIIALRHNNRKIENRAAGALWLVTAPLNL